MKITEELDAMRTMGFDPYVFLVLPRIIALMITLPLLIFLADVMGVLGGIDAVDPKIIRREAGLGKKYAAGLLMTPEELSSVNAISDLSVDLLPHVMTSN